MTDRTERFLYDLLRAGEFIARPSWQGGTETFECWASRRGYLRGIRELEARGLIEIAREPGRSMKRVVRLTELGRLHAVGGRDPELEWRRPWDGKWRVVVFDLPAKETALRQKLWRFLHENHFGWLQRSTWISPDSHVEVEKLFAGFSDASSVLSRFEGWNTGAEGDAGLVGAAWNFSEINRRYAVHAEVADVPLEQLDIQSWMIREREAWDAAVEIDPFLPYTLHPTGYAGPRAWRKKQEIFRKLARFSPTNFSRQL